MPRSTIKEDSKAGGSSRPHPFDQWVDFLPKESPEVTKRVSLDATETWNGDDDDLEDVSPGSNHDAMMILEWPAEDLVEDMELPGIIYEEDDEEDVKDPQTGAIPDLLLGVSSAPNEDLSEDTDGGEHRSLEAMFEKQRAQLALSMRRSSESRKWLEKHIKQRANLANVLADIEQSSKHLNHILLHEPLVSCSSPAENEDDDLDKDMEEEDQGAEGDDHTMESA